MTRWPPVRFTALIALAISVVAIALSVPPLRVLIERSMVWHMAVQMPLLIVGGWWSTKAVGHTRCSRAVATWNRYGLTGFSASLGIIAFWMLPLTIDRAVVSPRADAFKVLTLFACGAMLQHSFKCTPAVLQLFFVGTVVSMMTWLGIYFATTDLRLCTVYLLQSQINAGGAIVGLGITFGCAWLVGVVRQLQDPGARFST